jgi:hypothetical protein
MQPSSQLDCNYPIQLGANGDSIETQSLEGMYCSEITVPNSARKRQEISPFKTSPRSLPTQPDLGKASNLANRNTRARTRTQDKASTDGQVKRLPDSDQHIPSVRGCNSDLDSLYARLGELKPPSLHAETDGELRGTAQEIRLAEESGATADCGCNWLSTESIWVIQNDASVTQNKGPQYCEEEDASGADIYDFLDAFAGDVDMAAMVKTAEQIGMESDCFCCDGTESKVIQLVSSTSRNDKA